LNYLRLLLAPLLFFTSCEKEVKINLSSSEPQLVVNGQIELAQPPFIVLTKSIGYFAQVDLQTLQNSFIHDAVIRVSDGSRQITLREYGIDTSNAQTSGKFYFYTIDVGDPASLDFRGEAEKFYSLEIMAEGKSYRSVTKIPNCKPPDSLVARPPRVPPADLSAAMQLSVIYTDPDTPGNALRFFTKRNSNPFYPALSSVVDDQAFNGAKGAEYPISVGAPRTAGGFNDSTGYVFRGDTVTLRWCAIDRASYNFFSTYEFSVGTVGNPFSSPINVRSNIDNGALGIWVGYGSYYTTIVVPK
jgi:hypothetical protein